MTSSEATQLLAEPAQAPRARARIGRSVRLALTVAALVAIAYAIDWREFVARLAGADARLLGLAAVLFVTDRLLMSYKWGLLLAVLGVRLSLLANWGLYSLVTVLGLLMPATVGGDVVRVSWLWRHGAAPSAATASIALERLVGSLVALGFSAVALLYLGASAAGAQGLDRLLPVVLLAMVGIGAVTVAAFSSRSTSWLDRVLRGRFAGKVVGWLGRVQDAYRSFLDRPGAVIAFCALTVLEYALITVFTWVVALALDLQLGLLPFGAALAVALLVARLPIAIDGIGVFEGTLILLLALFGVDPAATVALAVVARAMSIVLCTPPALALIGFSNLSWRELRHAPGA